MIRGEEPVPVYVYRCSRCGDCYACQHTLDRKRRLWRCKDCTARTGVDVGVRVPPKFAKA